MDCLCQPQLDTKKSKINFDTGPKKTKKTKPKQKKTKTETRQSHPDQHQDQYQDRQPRPTPIICSWSGGMLRSPYTVAEEEKTIFLHLRQEKIKSNI